MGPNPSLCSLPLEALSRICKIVSSSYWTEQSSPGGDLTSLALTCRFLSEPAFNTLWHTLDTLGPLLGTLPEDLCIAVPFNRRTIYRKGDHDFVGGTQLVFLRAPIRQDFGRFFTYSRRVKKIGPEPVVRDALTDELVWNYRMREYTLTCPHHRPFVVWDLLSRFAPRPLLPNVQSVFHWERDEEIASTSRGGLVGSDISSYPADLLFGPRLKEANIHYTTPFRDPDHATDLVRTLSSTASVTLEHLSIEAQPRHPELRYHGGSLSCPELGFFHRLTSFSGRTVRVAPEALIALSRLPHLESLVLHISAAEYAWNALTHERSDDFFANLKQLALYEIGFDWCAAFLQVLSSTSLRRLSVRSEPHELPDPELLEELCTIISELPSAEIISDLIIVVGTTRYAPGAFNETYWSEDIAPLFTTLRALQRFIIKGHCTTIVDDTLLQSLSECCPDIVELVIAWNHNVELRPDTGRSSEDDDEYPLATPSGLLHLAQLCPRLKTLALAVDWSWFSPSYQGLRPRYPPPPPLHISGPAVHALREFDGSGSLFCNEARVASVISLLFPQLSVLRNDYGWLDIYSLYLRFVRMRAQERACAERERKRCREPDSYVELGDVFRL
ncbi:hypothetical protein VTO73DRAFT_5676 [Trametes versicolor]